MEPIQLINPNTPEFRSALRSIGREVYLAGIEAGKQLRKDDWVCEEEARRLIGGTGENNSCSKSKLFRLASENEISFSQSEVGGTRMYDSKSISAYHERNRKMEVKKKRKGNYKVLYIADKPTGTN